MTEHCRARRTHELDSRHRVTTPHWLARAVITILLLASVGSATAANIAGNASLLNQAQADALETRIGRGFQTFSLRYRSDVHGASSAIFHTRVDGLPRTLSVYRITSPVNAVVSGYVDTPWRTDQTYDIVPAGSSNAFMTQFDTMAHAVPVWPYQKYNNSAYGPTFGGGHDIYIDSTMLVGYVNRHTYPFGANNAIGAQGYANIQLDRVEVYEVLDGIEQYQLVYAAGPNGTISGITPQTLQYGQSGSAITAIPDSGYNFIQWSDGRTDNPRTDSNVTANVNVTAQFALPTFTLTYVAGANGSISGSSPQTVNIGSDGSEVIAVPDAEHFFVQWSDGVLTAARTDTNVSANISVTAEFLHNPYTLTYSAGGNGSISGISPQSVLQGAAGSEVVAVADANYHFVQWSDGLLSAARTDSNVMADLSVTATFAIDTYALNYSAGANGLLVGPGSQTVNYGTSGLPVYAVAQAHHHFVQWSDGVQGALRMDTNVMADVNASAVFAIDTYALSYSAGSGGSVLGDSMQTVAHGGDGTAVTATAAAGYHFVQWSDGSTQNPRSDHGVIASLSVSAVFANAAPAIAAPAEQVVLEDSGTRMLTVSVSDLESAAADLVVTATSSLPSLVPHPLISAGLLDGERLLSFAPIAERNGGPITITLNISDPLGASTQTSFDITVTAVNDAPSIVLGAVAEHPVAATGVRSLSHFALFDAGPADEDATQTVADYLIGAISDPDGVLVGGSLDISNAGTLGYTLSGVGGIATISTRVRDDGGTGNGGEDTSPASQFSIQVARGADLQIAVDNQRNGLLDGEITSYAVVVANAGPNAVADAVLASTLSANLVNASWTCVQASSTATCPSPDSGTGAISGLVSLGVDEYLRFDLSATTDASAGAFVSVHTSISTPAGTAAINMLNDLASDSDPIVPEAIFRDGFGSVEQQQAFTVPGAAAALSD